MSLPESRIIRLFQLGKQKFFNVSRHADASDNAWPKFDQRRDYQFARQRDDMQVVVEVIAATAVLRLAKGTCVTFPIVTNAADVIPAVVGEENDGARRGAASRKSRRGKTLAHALAAPLAARASALILSMFGDCREPHGRDGDTNVASP